MSIRKFPAAKRASMKPSRARISSRGMKGSAPTVEQKRFHAMLVAEIGCIASYKDGFFDGMCSIHHIDGRVKPNAHWLVLPLSAGNHQDGTGAPRRIAVHPWKTRFETKYGKQIDLLRECIVILIDRGCNVPEGALLAAGMDPKNNPASVGADPGRFTATI